NLYNHNFASNSKTNSWYKKAAAFVDFKRTFYNGLWKYYAGVYFMDLRDALKPTETDFKKYMEAYSFTSVSFLSNSKENLADDKNFLKYYSSLSNKIECQFFAKMMTDVKNIYERSENSRHLYTFKPITGLEELPLPLKETDLSQKLESLGVKETVQIDFEAPNLNAKSDTNQDVAPIISTLASELNPLANFQKKGNPL
ncbi:MAG: hypothetical protein MHPSP_003859, partial [Paramarteilia canceri]